MPWEPGISLYSAVLRSRADSLRLRVILYEWLTCYSTFLNIHRSGVLTLTALACLTWWQICVCYYCVLCCRLFLTWVRNVHAFIRLFIFEKGRSNTRFSDFTLIDFLTLLCLSLYINKSLYCKHTQYILFTHSFFAFIRLFIYVTVSSKLLKFYIYYNTIITRYRITCTSTLKKTLFSTGKTSVQMLKLNVWKHTTKTLRLVTERHHNTIKAFTRTAWHTAHTVNVYHRGTITDRRRRSEMT